MHAVVHHLVEKTYFFFVREEFLPKVLEAIVSKNLRNFFSIKKYYVHMYLCIDTYVLQIDQKIVNFLTVRTSGRKAGPIILSPKIPAQ